MCSNNQKLNMYLQFISLVDHLQIVYTYTRRRINYLKLIFFQGFLL